MTTPDDLIELLRQQLDEDERVALAVPEAPWSARSTRTCHPDVISVPRDRDHGRDDVVITDVWRDGVVEYATRYDPARILAEVDAKRRILDWLDEVERFMDCDDMSWHRLSGAVDVDHARRLLLLPFADREGYREEWRP